MFTITRFLMAALPFISDGMPLTVASSIVFLATGCSYAFAEVGAMAWVLSSAPTGHKSAAYGALVAGRSMGNLLGPPAGGALYDSVGFTYTLLIGALALIIPLATSYKTLLQPVDNGGKPRAAKKGSIFQEKAIVAAISLQAIGMIVSLWPFSAHSPQLTTTPHHHSPTPPPNPTQSNPNPNIFNP